MELHGLHYEGPFIYLDMDGIEWMFNNSTPPPNMAVTESYFPAETYWVFEKTATSDQEYCYRRKGEPPPPVGVLVGTFIIVGDKLRFELADGFSIKK